ncbi:MAG TPA: GntR family transcriptional regulator [Streptosporangiaceae bacterium]|nr:GntR family transcriptional regulator [Streptosporangiaceae bacterium]
MRQSESNYQILARHLRAQVLQGTFANGRQLPTEAELAAEFQVSRQTVRRAFQELVADGMVYRVRGKGTFAQPSGDGYVRQVGTVDDLMGLSEDTVMEVLAPLRRRVDPANAGRLRLLTDVVYEVRFVRTHDGVRFCATTVYLPPRVAELLSKVEELHTAGSVSTLTVIGLIDQQRSRAIAEAQQSITVERAPESVAAYLNCPPDHPMLRADRLYLDTEGDAVELAISHFLPEHYSYRIRLRRSG